MKKLPMPKGDVYKLPAYPSNKIFREFLKKLLQAMLNAPDREKARKGIHDSVHHKKELKLPPEVKSTKEKDILPIMDAFEQKHSKITTIKCNIKPFLILFVMIIKLNFHFCGEIFFSLFYGSFHVF